MASRSHHTLSSPRPQLAPLTADLWSSEVVPLLPADLEQQARILGAFRRRRALACATDLLRALLAAVLLTTSLRHLGAWALLAEVADISAPAWHKRLIGSRSFLAWLLADLLAPPLPPLRLIPQASGNILLVDATYLRQQGGSGDDWRLHTAYNFSTGRLAQVRLTDQRGGEHLGYYRLQAGDIVVADNGYGYRRSVATVRKQQADLVIRIRPATFPFEQADGQLIDGVAQLRKRGGSVREWAGWCTDADGERYRVRLIAAKLPPKEAAAARRRARKDARDHGRTVQPQTLLVAGWVLLITTVSATRWDAAAVLRVYRVRWQVELVFKRLKSILQLGQLRGRSQASIEAQVLALLVAWALQAEQAAWVRQHLAGLGQESLGIVSSWTLSVLSVDVLRQQVRGSWGQARVVACLAGLQRFLTSPVRQDREHQETVIRAWLERRPRPSLVVLAQAA